LQDVQGPETGASPARHVFRKADVSRMRMPGKFAHPLRQLNPTCRRASPRHENEIDPLSRPQRLDRERIGRLDHG
jgi:hypothetical protein